MFVKILNVFPGLKWLSGDLTQPHRPIMLSYDKTGCLEARWAVMVCLDQNGCHEI
jgi:hypothetical protein